VIGLADGYKFGFLKEFSDRPPEGESLFVLDILSRGLVDPSGGDLLQQVQRQLLLAGEDAEGKGGAARTSAMTAVTVHESRLTIV
jgi:hypothetical protein